MHTNIMVHRAQTEFLEQLPPEGGGWKTFFRKLRDSVSSPKDKKQSSDKSTSTSVLVFVLRTGFHAPPLFCHRNGGAVVFAL